VELPTYTSIWRIEKRLYKLYDFRLPMPLPVGQIAVFTAITVPYIILLTVLGLPFNHTLFWLYVLPPGVLTWLATRPVLESKRLPELIVSQARYLGEPSSWCRMAPLAEKDEMVVVGRVWRRAGQVRPATVSAASPAVVSPATARRPARSVRPAAALPALDLPAGAGPAGRVPSPARVGPPAGFGSPAGGAPGERIRVSTTAAAPAASAAPSRVAPQDTGHGVPAPGQDLPSPGRRQPAGIRRPGAFLQPPATQRPPETQRPPASPQPPRVVPPVVVVPVQRASAGPAPASQARLARPVERALSGPTDQRDAHWRDHVVVVPGGLGPGRPDHERRDRERVMLPLTGSRLVAVLGCTVGAGQTVTTLVVADLLASMRGEAVAALDLNPGPASLADLAATGSAMTLGGFLAGQGPVGPAGPGGPGGHAGPHTPSGPGRHAAPKGRPAQPGHPPHGQGRLDVIAPEVGGDGALAMDDLDYRRMFDTLSARYLLTLADPGASSVARVLAAADQVVLVVPASPDAARALAMTQEWLGAHGYDSLTANSIIVLNGLSKRSVPHAEQAELVVRGRCRAIVRIPWDDHLAEPPAERGIRDSLGPAGAPSRLAHLRPPVLQAYTALAGVLIAALSATAQRRRAAR
jgi:MinD-like ATPase involved in chromosome partitioning or flagellar assembly